MTKTVKYYADHYLCTGNTYYYRQELLHEGKEEYWGKPRLITKETYEKAKKNGHECAWTEHKKPLADVIKLDLVRPFYRKVN